MDMKVFIWTNLLTGETLADICNLKAPCKLRRAVPDYNDHDETNGLTPEVRIVAVSGNMQDEGWIAFDSVASQMDALAVLNLIICMGLLYRIQEALCDFIQAQAPCASKLCKPPQDSSRDIGPESHNLDGSPRHLLAHKALYGDPVSNTRWYLKHTRVWMAMVSSRLTQLHVFNFCKDPRATS